MADAPLCKDCRFTVPPVHQGSICLHAASIVQPPRSLVTGILPPSYSMRCESARVRHAALDTECGPTGRFWEPREPARAPR